MDKKYREHYSDGHKNNRIGTKTGLLDRDGNELLAGDCVIIGDNKEYPYYGIVFYHVTNEQWGAFKGLWYRGQDVYNPRCYGKFISIPKDNGMRMEIKKISIKEFLNHETGKDQ